VVGDEVVLGVRRGGGGRGGGEGGGGDAGMELRFALLLLWLSLFCLCSLSLFSVWGLAREGKGTVSQPPCFFSASVYSHPLRRGDGFYPGKDAVASLIAGGPCRQPVHAGFLRPAPSMGVCLVIQNYIQGDLVNTATGRTWSTCQSDTRTLGMESAFFFPFFVWNMEQDLAVTYILPFLKCKRINYFSLNVSVYKAIS
jgi:hypothetical protein